MSKRKKGQWEPIGKQLVRNVEQYREFEEKELYDSDSSISFTLDELAAKVKEWKKDAGGKAIITFSPTSYESIDITLRRPVPGSKITKGDA